MNTCVIEINGKEYTLCLTRTAVKQMESRGFNIQAFVEKPITYMDVLWAGGFVANHPEVNNTLANTLQETYKAEGGDVMEVINFLADEYSTFVNAPTDTKYEKKAKITKVNK